MATYEITLEFETVLSVDGTRVKSETNCIKHNRLPKLTKDVYTVFESTNMVAASLNSVTN